MPTIKIVPMPGPSGSGGNADTADFVFDTVTGDGDQSTMTVANHDMYIRTTRTEDQDADINIESADDLTIAALGDDININANDEIRLRTGDYENQWTFLPNGTIEFPNGSVQETAYVSPGQIIPLPDFLTYEEGREALPALNQNFGWDDEGVWFGPTALDNEEAQESYPVFSSFTMSETDKVEVSFSINITDFCSDAGICVYLDGTTPKWSWDPDATRIAAQFNCPSPQILGIEGISENTEGGGVPEPGTYRMVFIYDPTAETEKVVFEYFAEGNNNAINRITLNESLPSGYYRIGFASDNDVEEGPFDQSLADRTYIHNLEIIVNSGNLIYGDSLRGGSSGELESNTGDITFQGVKIIGAGTASGDGNEYGTIELVPDASRYEGDQYLIIDPTGPNHIHIRAGGDIDASTAELILGGEDTHVTVSDQERSVNILADTINIDSYVAPSSLNINTYSGAIINSNRTSTYSPEDKVVATLGDLPTGATGTFVSSDNKTITVTNGIITGIE